MKKEQIKKKKIVFWKNIQKSGYTIQNEIYNSKSVDFSHTNDITMWAGLDNATRVAHGDDVTWPWNAAFWLDLAPWDTYSFY